MKHLFYTIGLTLFCSVAIAQNVNKEAYKRYVDVDKYDQSLEGFIVLNNGTKEKTLIKYEEPYLLFDPALPLITYKSNDKEKAYLKSKLAGFYVNDQLYVREYFEEDSNRWVMVIRDGVIRESLFFNPNKPYEKPDYYTISRLVTNTYTLKSYNVGKLAINFAHNMNTLVNDNDELKNKVLNAEDGYKFFNYQQIIARYNMWYDQKNPGSITYHLDPPDYQKLIDNK